MNKKLVEPAENYLHVSIIILNWNTWQDTIECLESVLKSNYPNYTIFLIDNNSTNDSVKKINDWVAGDIQNIHTDFPQYIHPNKKKPLDFVTYNLDNNKNESKFIQKHERIYFLINEENSGFAKGNNIAIDISLKVKSDYIFILNNDTVIDLNCVSELIDFMTKKENEIATATIYEYETPEKIAIAGGNLSFWVKAFYYTKKLDSKFREVTFVSGCALMVHSSIFKKYGKLSEKFFFGEEDIEFSYRMNLNNVKMFCVYQSLAYHKVGSSAEQYFKNRPRKAFLHGLNRLVNMKDYFSPLKWNIWKQFILLYFFYIFIYRARLSILESLRLLAKMNYYAKKLDNVHKDTIDNIYREIGLL